MTLDRSSFPALSPSPPLVVLFGLLFVSVVEELELELELELVELVVGTEGCD